MEIRVAGSKLDAFVPPLSIQTLLENALKHNRVSEDAPLNISIVTEGDTLTVRNNLQPKQSRSESNGVGLENLRKRYALLGEVEPSFTVVDNEFVATISLVKGQ